MRQIEIEILNPGAIEESRKMMALCARLTQRGHSLNSMADLKDLCAIPASDSLIESLAALPHPTLQKMSVINVAVVGASRRFLAQITRHQNEVKFMSASLQYSDYSHFQNFVVPYKLIGTELEVEYLKHCDSAMQFYGELVKAIDDNDAAGYIAPQCLRNHLVISATPYQWKHMIRQRVCRRNTAETRYIMLKIWEALRSLDGSLFSDCIPECAHGACPEGPMSCRSALVFQTPNDILKNDFSKLYERGQCDED